MRHVSARMIKTFFAALLVFASAAAAQDANEMIRRVRLSATLMQSDLQGQIRSANGRTKTPISLFMRGENMQFHLESGERFHIRMGDEKCELLELDAQNRTRVFPAAKLVQPVAGTNITYEDLTLRFLYWPNAKLDKEEKIGNADCYRIRLDNPGREGAFGTVYVWIHKKYGAFWQIRAHDRAGRALKEFQVLDVMPLPDKSYTIKKMRINTLDANLRTMAITYLEFEDPKPNRRGPRGPRR